MSPRKRQFIPDQALDDAMYLFWEKGFEGTSIGDLVSRTGVNRFSIYNTFGDKRSLFLQACVRFSELMIATRLQPMVTGRSGLADLRRFFLIRTARDGEKILRGCMATNAVVEQAMPNDPVFAAWLKQFQASIENGLLQAVRRAKAAGELPDCADEDRTVKLLMCLRQGLNVMDRGGAEPAQLNEIVDSALAALAADPPSVSSATQPA